MNTKRTADYWDERNLSDAHQRREWSLHPLAVARQKRILGDRGTQEWFVQRYPTYWPARYALSVGAGTAAPELAMLVDGTVERFDLYDVSPASLDKARADARHLGVEDRARFFCADINNVEIPEATYDLVTFFSSLHHMERLDEVLGAVYRALAPGGMFLAGEYVGPDRFDYPPEHVGFAQMIYDVIAPELKNPQAPVLQWPTPAQVIAADPTEAIHSSAIIEIVRRTFAHVDVTPIYGALPFMLFWSLNCDALYETEQGWKLVQLILDLDMALVDAGRLPSYWAYIVATKPSDR